MLESFDVQMTQNGFLLSVYAHDTTKRTVWLERGKLLAEIDRMLKEMEGNMHD